MTKQKNRTLGALEKTFWLLDQIDSKDFALAAEVEGKKSFATWSNAINKAQQRHYNLSVKISLDDFIRPILKHDESLIIPLRIVEANNDFRWEQKVEKELSIIIYIETTFRITSIATGIRLQN